jgi:hypothetical protein
MITRSRRDQGRAPVIANKVRVSGGRGKGGACGLRSGGLPGFDGSQGIGFGSVAEPFSEPLLVGNQDENERGSSARAGGDSF